jgi:alkylation response protein AidB-like acyl-CoA dehydrogenase
MLWLSYADRLADLLHDFRPSTELDRHQYATLAMDNQALRLLGSAALARAARGEEDVPGMAVLKLLGAEAAQSASEWTLSAVGAEGLVHPSTSTPFMHMNHDGYAGGWFDRYGRSFAGTIAGGTSEIQRNIIAQRVLGLPRR